MQNYPFVITICSEKGGVGKTTLATNLAIFLKALREDLQVTVFSFDNHFTVDRMFALSGEQPRGTVADLLKGVQGGDLLQMGQYGVNYIPSSNELSELRGALQGPMFLARMMANANIPGIVIIDTRPELDILTQNALYAADQVFIPVKDMASLENCKNIFALFDSRGLDKKSLALIPCLVDSRIKFDGMFRDQRTLLKAYAINRGYRCLDSYISKSPKVDSLNTNPDGKIYPVLTHARGTDVYGQFTTVARQVLSAFKETTEPRSIQFSRWLKSEDERRNAAYVSRRTTIRLNCPICNRPLIDSGINNNPSHYYENLDGTARGFIHKECFTGLIIPLFNPNGNTISSGDPFNQLLIDVSATSTVIFRPVNVGSSTSIEVVIIDKTGRQVIKQVFAVREYSESFLNTREGSLYRLLNATLGQTTASTVLLVQPVPDDDHEAILKEDGYRRFRKIKQQIATSASV
ncbi:chromosome partitioning protein ParA [Geobacter sp. OR-1]|uniref:ParA family protein n=1 Tax=Geobacter sp. OR-1 TaxID=1266765 RepID=UPI0005428C73|nr:ParA family protein [Geobacter sp. OR-1]GAM11648.1 chromosome partitioning protein ParA [Geobacter sp. OR-1]